MVKIKRTIYRKDRSWERKEERAAELIEWRDTKLEGAFEAIAARAKDLDMAVDVNERVIRCPGMDKPITKNHFRLIMRNEIAGYLEGLSRQTKQAALDVLYEGFIGGSIVESKKPENADCLLTHEEWQNAHKSTYSTPQSV